MTGQLALGVEARDKGVARVTSNTPDWWKDAADGAITYFAQTHLPFTADDVRSLVGDPPNHPSALSARFAAAAKSGLIVEVGSAKSTRAEGHARRLLVWRGA